MSQVSRRSLIAGSLGAGLVLPALALADEQCGERPNTAPALQPPLLLTDWAWLARYRPDNEKLIAGGAKVHAVFLGDSITEGWASTDPDFFSKGNVGRGISAQTTPQLLVRMHADVIALKPRVVHIMAGTNDIAHNTGPMTAQDSQNNVMAMCEIAKAHKLLVVLGSVPPASKYWWKPEAQPKPAALAMNEWLRSYAKQIGAKYADYAAVLTDAKGDVKLELAKDEVHPTAAGYAAMRTVAEAAIG
ncbi:MAG TPA: GDSL-type esterase/lipase family protein [Steroidobacteraceae bacterium]|jgi:lysophospholipase L1-like esterase|nr:GDSL-type esterase/lipase family protein [Steroidobacteraceae bacterium]